MSASSSGTTAQPDGERILTWQQIYALPQIPDHLIVVGSGVTGAELAQAYLGLGTQVTLISSRDLVLPGEDQDAAAVIEDVFRRRGMNVLNRSRMASSTAFWTWTTGTWGTSAARPNRVRATDVQAMPSTSKRSSLGNQVVVCTRAAHDS